MPIIKLLSQHVSGIIMPIIRRNKTVYYCIWRFALVVLAVVGCGVKLRRELCALCEGYCLTVTFTQCTQLTTLCALCEGYCLTVTFTQCTQFTTQLHTTTANTTSAEHHRR